MTFVTSNNTYLYNSVQLEWLIDRKNQQAWVAQVDGTIDLLQKSFSSNFWAGGTPTPHEKMTMSGMGILPVLAIALQ